MTITPEQLKAARGLLAWSRADLAGHVGVSAATVGKYEMGQGLAKVLDLAEVRAALESAGVMFVEENGKVPGVRLRKAAK